MRNVEYRPRAAYDVESVVIYIGQILDPPQAAHAWYDELTAAVNLLCDMPDLGRPFEDERLVVKGRRTYLVRSYRVFYSYSNEKLIIWRVIHTSQNIDEFALVDLSD